MAKDRVIEKIIVHCSATPEGRDVKAKEIKRWHIDERGFSDIGYHYVIRLDGTVEEGRDVKRVGAHCKGQNRGSIGICYVGGLDEFHRAKNTLNGCQEVSLIKLIEKLKSEYGYLTLYGHNEFSSKDCPCFNVPEWAKSVNL